MNMKSLPLLRLLFGAALLVFLQTACKQDQDITTNDGVATFSHKAITDWSEMYLQVERYAPGYRPGPAPRSLAYLGLACYEACVSNMEGYNSVATLYPGLSVPQIDKSQAYHWPTVINGTYYNLMKEFFPEASQQMKDQMLALYNTRNAEAQRTVSQEVFDRSLAHGQNVAKAVWAYAKTDPVGHGYYTDPFKGYDWATAYKKEGDWRPTSSSGPMFAHWGEVRTFAVKSGEKLCRQPLPYSSSNNSGIYVQAMEVYTQNTPTISDESRWVAEFWSDDLVGLTFSPGPRWLAIGNQALVHQNSNLATALEMNAKVGMAINDAAVACWYSKYAYNVERPITYINRIVDPKWQTSLNNPLTGEKSLTPSFPAYPSGHATMGAAGAEALASVFGYNYSMTDRCHEGRTEFVGKPRSFTSFLEMAQENAWSRVPLGVHFRMDADEGVRFGTVIGRKVNALPWKK